MSVLIRKGTREDCKALLSLIKELAVFEKAPKEVVVTKEILQKDFNDNVFDFFVAEERGNVKGIALFFIKYSTWKGKCIYLDDIVVTEKARGQGIGKLLFEALITHAKQLGVNKIDWQVLNWNEKAINFYEKFNAEFDDEWVNGKLMLK